MMAPMPILVAVLGGMLVLSSCSTETEILESGPFDAQAAELADAPPVKLPPAIASSVTFRCADQGLVYADFLTNGTVLIRSSLDEPATVLAPTDGKPPYARGGYSLSGKADKVTFTAPGRGRQTCRR